MVTWPALALTLPLLAAPPPAFIPGQVTERVACSADASQTYALYLPSHYDAARRWPTLLVFDPRGRATTALELFREAAERFGWIIMSSYDTRSDGPAEFNVKALDAMWPEAHTRFASDPARIYLAGFSGGAHLAWEVAATPGAVAGVIASGGRYIPELLPKTPTYASFATAGDVDFNYQGTRRVDEVLGARGAVHRLEIFAGPHRWMPPELAAQAIEWMQLVAMRRGLAPRDEAVIGRAFVEDVAAAKALADAGRPLAAMRRYRAVVATFSGLADTSEPEREAARLSALPRTVALLDEEHQADEMEARYDNRLARVIGAFLGQDPAMSGSRLLAELGVGGLQRLAAGDGARATTARRVLNRIHTQAAFYLARDMTARADLPRLVTCLEVATAIRPEDAVAWYNLACARSRGGLAKDALAALATALDRGFSDAALLASDPDLAAIRKLPEFAPLAARLARAR
jgi:predicted esterase